MHKKFIYSFEAMSTGCEVTLYSENKAQADSVAKAILLETKRLETKYNYYNENSLLSQINARETTELDRETKELLQLAKRYYGETNGIFDITIATIKDLYKNERDVQKLREKKAGLLAYVGCEHFHIKRDKITFDNFYTKIDLGGFVKEYAVDKAVKIVKKHKIRSALINYGGDIYALGKKPNGEEFVVGIKDPNNPKSFIEEVSLENQGLATSASYERKYRIEDEEHSHIISKKAQTSLQKSVTVISSNCLQSGVFSTALMIDESIESNDRVLIFC